ncbi:MAG TPA: hypothetical protein VFW93_12800 [Aquabacterium sp.]|uniref:hypothetical protein n=1 Tax=Aquabacterium sp. TaxID=1872578 RepID=UPI002E33A9AF|nr:hypothetical protein [Aquabacterium sp.]HEX5357093.1 hypothetical protein [Aquabacterium sp.]
MLGHTGTRLALIGALCWPMGCCAWGTLADLDAPPAVDQLGVGLGWLQVPRSPEGTHHRQGLLPLVDYIRHDGWFLSTQHGAGWQTTWLGGSTAGVRLWPQWGRAREDAGLNAPAIGPRLQTQAFGNVRIHPALWWQSALSQGAAQHRQGWQAETGLSSGWTTSAGWIGIGVAVSYANAAFKRDYLGSDRAGWADWSWRIGASQQLDKSWRVEGQWLQARTWPDDDRAHHSRRFMINLVRDIP